MGEPFSYKNLLINENEKKKEEQQPENLHSNPISPSNHSNGVSKSHIQGLVEIKEHVLSLFEKEESPEIIFKYLSTYFPCLFSSSGFSIILAQYFILFLSKSMAEGDALRIFMDHVKSKTKWFPNLAVDPDRTIVLSCLIDKKISFDGIRCQIVEMLSRNIHDRCVNPVTTKDIQKQIEEVKKKIDSRKVAESEIDSDKAGIDGQNSTCACPIATKDHPSRIIQSSESSSPLSMFLIGLFSLSPSGSPICRCVCTLPVVQGDTDTSTSRVDRCLIKNVVSQQCMGVLCWQTLSLCNVYDSKIRFNEKFVQKLHESLGRCEKYYRIILYYERYKKESLLELGKILKKTHAPLSLSFVFNVTLGIVSDLLKIFQITPSSLITTSSEAFEERGGEGKKLLVVAILKKHSSLIASYLSRLTPSEKIPISKCSKNRISKNSFLYFRKLFSFHINNESINFLSSIFMNLLQITASHEKVELFHSQLQLLFSPGRETINNTFSMILSLISKSLFRQYRILCGGFGFISLLSDMFELHWNHQLLDLKSAKSPPDGVSTAKEEQDTIDEGETEETTQIANVSSSSSASLPVPSPILLIQGLCYSLSHIVSHSILDGFKEEEKNEEEEGEEAEIPPVPDHSSDKFLRSSKNRNINNGYSFDELSIFIRKLICFVPVLDLSVLPNPPQKKPHFYKDEYILNILGKSDGMLWKKEWIFEETKRKDPISKGKGKTANNIHRKSTTLGSVKSSSHSSSSQPPHSSSNDYYSSPTPSPLPLYLSGRRRPPSRRVFHQYPHEYSSAIAHHTTPIHSSHSSMMHSPFVESDDMRDYFIHRREMLDVSPRWVHIRHQRDIISDSDVHLPHNLRSNYGNEGAIPEVPTHSHTTFGPTRYHHIIPGVDSMPIIRERDDHMRDSSMIHVHDIHQESSEHHIDSRSGLIEDRPSDGVSISPREVITHSSSQLFSNPSRSSSITTSQISGFISSSGVVNNEEAEEEFVEGRVHEESSSDDSVDPYSPRIHSHIIADISHDPLSSNTNRSLENPISSDSTEIIEAFPASEEQMDSRSPIQPSSISSTTPSSDPMKSGLSGNISSGDIITTYIVSDASQSKTPHDPSDDCRISLAQIPGIYSLKNDPSPILFFFEPHTLEIMTHHYIAFPNPFQLPNLRIERPSIISQAYSKEEESGQKASQGTGGDVSSKKTVDIDEHDHVADEFVPAIRQEGNYSPQVRQLSEILAIPLDVAEALLQAYSSIQEIIDDIIA
ncbi:hypothetical protein ADUPG1_000460 [Aduncisulcus paluster]|uniref:Uncharacterized protein n=1 Tax=Aduncisulcus paluster TaxID=2918883 RepID=A0ABQ5K9J0_9EUKA|nr:hypothetical protein ADUPG1_000460 [Aduncisulcus paluster]